jgi:hypothetical protein
MNELRHGCGHLITEGEELAFSPGDGWVCPGCGGHGGQFAARFDAGTVGQSMSATATASNMVGRSIQVLDTNDDQVNALVNEVQQFAAQLTRGPADESLLEFGTGVPVGTRIADEFVKSVSIGLTGSYYRGRWLAENEVAEHQFTRPPGVQRAGRYNLSGDSVLYLASDASVVHSELARREEAGKALFVQEFALQLDDVRVVSVQGPGLTAELDALLFFSETIPTEASDDPASYRPSQFLRLLADREDVEAIVFPSVRAGFPGVSASLNVVLLGSAAAQAETMVSGSPLTE